MIENHKLNPFGHDNKKNLWDIFDILFDFVFYLFYNGKHFYFMATKILQNFLLFRSYFAYERTF